MLAIFMLAFLPLGDVGKTPPPREALPMPVESIEGIYRSVAMEGGKSQVSAVSVVKAGEAFLIQWNTGATGVGIRTGDTLAVGWTQESGGKLFRGVTVYRIQGRRLVGRWAALPGMRLQDETLTWLGTIEE